MEQWNITVDKLAYVTDAAHQGRHRRAGAQADKLPACGDSACRPGEVQWRQGARGPADYDVCILYFM